MVQVCTVSKEPLIYLVLCYVTCSPFTYWQLTHTQYGVVIDAGSAHTDIYIYSWQVPLFNNTGLVKQEFNWSINGDLLSLHDYTALSIHKYMFVCVPQWNLVVCVCVFPLSSCEKKTDGGVAYNGIHHL